TDSFRLAEKRVNQNITTTDELAILIPQKNTQNLLSILEQLDENKEIDVLIDNDQFSVYTNNIYITLRTIDGSFPDYQKIIPKDATTTVTVLKQDLSQIIKKAGVFSDKFNKINIKVDANTKKITISTTSGDAGETEDYIQGVIEGETSTMTINHKYVIDCLQSVHSDSVILSFYGQGKPLVISGVGDKSFTYLVMPMNN
ncbi:MAG: DNA polymerase III subunit beta, partial [Candidatus Pacebacteria bacterium]|nr:DNA polymerase III subunit beta [Candidatus Paceibacterota bacterium]